jgi:hypothetical protein
MFFLTPLVEKRTKTPLKKSQKKKKYLPRLVAICQIYVAFSHIFLKCRLRWHSTFLIGSSADTSLTRLATRLTRAARPTSDSLSNSLCDTLSKIRTSNSPSRSVTRYPLDFNNHRAPKMVFFGIQLKSFNPMPCKVVHDLALVVRLLNPQSK